MTTSTLLIILTIATNGLSDDLKRHVSPLIPSPVTLDAATAQIKKPDAVLEEKEVELDIPVKTFRFMLARFPLAAMLAGELGITDTVVQKLDDGYLFSDPWFMLWLDSGATGKNNDYRFEFRYSIGFHAMVPIKTTGKGSAMVTVKSSDGGTVIADITMRLKAYDAPLDKIVRKAPFIIKALFSVKLEQLFREAELLSYEFSENPGSVMEIVDDEDSEFTTAQKKAIKKLLGEKVKS